MYSLPVSRLEAMQNTHMISAYAATIYTMTVNLRYIPGTSQDKFHDMQCYDGNT